MAEDGGPAASAGVPTPTPTSEMQRRAEGQTAGASEPEGETVYITRTGSKYHRSSCQHLRRSRIPVSLKEASQSYICAQFAGRYSDNISPLYWARRYKPVSP